jgi:hypothetical protein
MCKGTRLECVLLNVFGANGEEGEIVGEEAWDDIEAKAEMGLGACCVLVF